MMLSCDASDVKHLPKSSDDLVGDGLGWAGRRHLEAGLVRPERLQRRQLRWQERRRHVVTQSCREAPLQLGARRGEMDEDDRGMALAEDVAVAPAEGRTRDDRVFGRLLALADPGRDRPEPR